MDYITSIIVLVVAVGSFLLGFMITYEPEHKKIERKKVERIFRTKK
jgi:hypothetical protein